MPTPFHVLIPAGGTGSRAGAGLPKQYRIVAGHSVLAHTVAAFAAVAGVQRVLVCVSADALAARRVPPLPGVAEVVPCAAATRADTVRNGLQWLRQQGVAPDAWVLVHDAARCLVQPLHIESLVTACAHDAVGGILALPLADTLKQQAPHPPKPDHSLSEPRIAHTLPRADKWLAQTPQMFRLGALADALQAARSQGTEVTDEASAMEALGLLPRLVPGSAGNFKLTYPEDFALAEAVLAARSPIRNPPP